MSLLLDTCAAIWTAEDQLATEAQESLEDVQAQNGTIFVSAITAWELGMLMSRGRITSPLSPLAWFDRFTGNNFVEVVALTPDILVNASYLPGKPPRDPADQIIVSTSRKLGVPIMTRDREILAYADSGHVNAIAC